MIKILKGSKTFFSQSVPALIFDIICLNIRTSELSLSMVKIFSQPALCIYREGN